MVQYICDWCKKSLPLNCISIITVENGYNEPVTMHICRECGRVHFPASIQPNLSWTAIDDNSH